MCSKGGDHHAKQARDEVPEARKPLHCFTVAAVLSSLAPLVGMFFLLASLLGNKPSTEGCLVTMISEHKDVLNMERRLI